jgi:cyanophycinase
MTTRVPVLPVLVLSALATLPLAGASPGQTAASAPAAASGAPAYGPARGTLVVVGGNMSDDFGVPQRFIRLAGGPAKKFVVVPTNGGNHASDGSPVQYDADTVLAPWRRRGLTNLVMLHTSDPKVADTAAFAAPLADADAVWFDGGRQWNMADSYLGTRTLQAFRAVLDRGGVIGGTSAGATILGEYLVRGDTKSADIVMTDEPHHQRGFALLRRTAIDQHINTRDRWDDLVPVVLRFPELLGLGLSEDTAIVVTGDRFEVIGRWKVTVHDPTATYQPWEKPYRVLSAGDVYDMAARKIVRLGTGADAPR